MRTRIGPVLFAALAVLVAAPLSGESQSVRMQISATVVARAIATVDQAPSVVVTEADIVRGYVDVVEPVEVRVRTNNPSGYLLQVTKTHDELAAVELHFGDTVMNVVSESWVARPRVAAGETVSMRVRVRLSPAATVGSYSLPLAISALPL